MPDRTAFNTIVFVLVTASLGAMSRASLGCSGVTAWRRLRDWQQAGSPPGHRLVGRGRRCAVICQRYLRGL